jgi:hypothetical protein
MVDAVHQLRITKQKKLGGVLFLEQLPGCPAKTIAGQSGRIQKRKPQRATFKQTCQLTTGHIFAFWLFGHRSEGQCSVWLLYSFTPFWGEKSNCCSMNDMLRSQWPINASEIFLPYSFQGTSAVWRAV